MAKFFKEIWVAYGTIPVMNKDCTVHEMAPFKDTALAKLQETYPLAKEVDVIRYVQDTVKNDQT